MSMQTKIEGQRAMEALFSKPETQAALDGSAEAEKAIRIAKAHADAMALHYIAECECPDDLKQWAINNKIPTFAEVTWQAGFVQGWRMALAMQTRALEGCDAYSVLRQPCGDETKECGNPGKK